MEKKKQIYLLIFLILIFFSLNYNFIDEKLGNFLLEGQAQKVLVDRVIDGDTFVTGIENVRLLGINTPERGEEFYEEAKNFLENLILNKEVTLKYLGEREDKYGRTLAYIYFNGKNINLKLVENGFANYYFYSGKDIYSKDLIEAWNSCIENNLNLCEKSNHICSSCISINEKKIINSCRFNCDIEGWEIKGEGRNKFIFDGILESGNQENFNLDLENSGGSLFLRDSEGKLVLWGDY
ncbi:MAG: thermonuclease family protein [Candidatus Pacearchaeota archaeon]